MLTHTAVFSILENTGRKEERKGRGGRREKKKKNKTQRGGMAKEDTKTVGLFH